MPNIVLNGRELKTDSNNLVSLTDIWKASGLSTSYEPMQWAKSGPAKKFIQYIQEHEKHEPNHVFYRKRGRRGGTFGHWQIALAYAQWLSPELKAQVQDIFRRYDIGDPSLAEEVLDNQFYRGNLSDSWTNKRVESKASRNHFTSVLQFRGVAGAYGLITNGIYEGCLGKRARPLRREKGLPANPSKPPATRDAMDYEELTAVKMSEDLAALRMIREEAEGVDDCREIAEESGQEIRKIINKEIQS